MTTHKGRRPRPFFHARLPALVGGRWALVRGAILAGYRDLEAWQKAMDLARGIYRATSKFPNEERFGLTSQLRRASVSIPSNIAEGHARNTPQEMIRFCGIALGSLAELETQLILSSDLGFLGEDESNKLLETATRVGRMLHGLIRSNRAR